MNTVPANDTAPTFTRNASFGKRALIDVLIGSALLSSFFIPLEKLADAADNAYGGEITSDRVLVRIGDHGISPNNLSVAPGTTVLWRNEAGESVKVKFVSQTVSTTCKEPRGFGGDFNGIHESGRIVGGEVASLCFLEPNEYQYIVDYQSPASQAPISGTIHVALEH